LDWVNDHSSVFDGLEEEEAVLPNVKINVVFGLIGDIRSEISADEGVPVSIVFTVEFVLQVGGDLLNGMHLLEGVFGYRKYFGLHLRADVLRLDYGT
jgi:hypothetical protein